MWSTTAFCSPWFRFKCILSSENLQYKRILMGWCAQEYRGLGIWLLTLFLKWACKSFSSYWVSQNQQKGKFRLAKFNVWFALIFFHIYCYLPARSSIMSVQWKCFNWEIIVWVEGVFQISLESSKIKIAQMGTLFEKIVFCF